MDETRPWLVVGLGNPGKEYARNRHNVGFMVAELLAGRINASFAKHRRAVARVAEGLGVAWNTANDAVLAEGRLGLGGPKLILVEPMTYMNLSGAPVASLSQFYKVPPEQIVAVHDELDIPYGQLRVKCGGGEGGHNGLRSMSKSLGTKDYVRVRFGVGRPPGRQDPADFVLSDFSAAERKELDFLVDRAADAVESVITRGVEPTQNAYHGG